MSARRRLRCGAVAALLLVACEPSASTPAASASASAAAVTASAPAPVEAAPTASATAQASAAPGASGRPRASASAAPSPASPPGTVSFISVGDIMMSRRTAKAMDDAKDVLLPFRGMHDMLLATDFNFGNLEAPFSSKDTYQTGPAHIFNMPKRHVEGLVKYRFKVVNLANNHAFDQGEDGVRTTLSHLHENGIKTVGTGMTERQAFETEVLTVNGIRIGFVGVTYSSVNDDGTRWLPYVARMQRGGRMGRAVRALRKRCDFLVATMHAGVEYVATGLDGQRQVAKAMIDGGADIVFGHHPHVVQQVETIDGRYFFYSLGNFIFDHTKKHTDEGAAVKTVLSKGDDGRVTIRRLEVIPYVIENLATPRPIDGPRADAILKRMKVKSPVLVGR